VKICEIQISEFINKVLLEHSHAYSHIHLLFMATFKQLEQSWEAGTESTHPINPEVFIIWPITELCPPFFCSIKADQTALYHSKFLGSWEVVLCVNREMQE
jgi:hypothetical protein